MPELKPQVTHNTNPSAIQETKKPDFVIKAHDALLAGLPSLQGLEVNSTNVDNLLDWLHQNKLNFEYGIPDEVKSVLILKLRSGLGNLGLEEAGKYDPSWPFSSIGFKKYVLATCLDTVESEGYISAGMLEGYLEKVSFKYIDQK